MTNSSSAIEILMKKVEDLESQLKITKAMLLENSRLDSLVDYLHEVIVVFDLKIDCSLLG